MASIKWRLIRFGPRLLYRSGLGPLIGRMILLLTTTGRKSGRPHEIPLQYETIDGSFYVAAAQGKKADWFRNIVANPEVKVKVGSGHIRGHATPITNPEEIADFLELRLKRHPRVVGAIMRWAGIPRNPTRAQLTHYAQLRAMAVIKPFVD